MADWEGVASEVDEATGAVHQEQYYKTFECTLRCHKIRVTLDVIFEQNRYKF